jgi:hypothetical protein
MGRSFRAEPFLWIHLAGIAVVPLALLTMMLGLAVGTPFSVYGGEVIFLIVFGWLPVMVMQWFKPFEIFSLLIIALRPDSLGESQLRILSLFKRGQQRWITLLGGMISLGLLWLVYYFAPIAYPWVTNFPQIRLAGLLLGAIAYFMANLFFQVPLSVLGVLSTAQASFEAATPLDPDEIKQGFTIPGIKLRQIPLVPRIES